MEAHNTKQGFREHAIRIAAIVGLVAVLLLGAWGIIQLAFVIPNFFSNLGSGRSAAPETLSASVPLSVTSGQSFPLSWTHRNSSGHLLRLPGRPDAPLFGADRRVAKCAVQHALQLSERIVLCAPSRRGVWHQGRYA